MTATIIEKISGIPADSDIALAYARRSDAREHAELSYQLLLHPETPGPVSLTERRAIAFFVAALWNQPTTRAHYLGLLTEVAPDLAAIMDPLTRPATGPWGSFPAGPLSAEDAPGTAWTPPPALSAAAGPRLAAGLAHAHMLATHPRDAKAAALAVLGEAGWDEDAIVTLSQLVAFVSFQIRVIAGFTALVAAKAA